MKTTNSACLSKYLTTTIASAIPHRILASCDGKRGIPEDTYSKVGTTTVQDSVGLSGATDIEASFSRLPSAVNQTDLERASTSISPILTI